MDAEQVRTRRQLQRTHQIPVLWGPSAPLQEILSLRSLQTSAPPPMGTRPAFQRRLCMSSGQAEGGTPHPMASPPVPASPSPGHLTRQGRLPDLAPLGPLPPQLSTSASTSSSSVASGSGPAPRASRRRLPRTFSRRDFLPRPSGRQLC